MKQTQKLWLESVSWESVVTVNKALCRAQKLDPLVNHRGCEAARRRWEAATSSAMTLKEVLDLCRECHELAPFTFNNGNTFAATGRALIDDWINTLPPVEAQVIRTTVGHYIVGLIARKELLQVLRHFEKTWQPRASQPKRIEESAPLLQLQPAHRA